MTYIDHCPIRGCNVRFLGADEQDVLEHFGQDHADLPFIKSDYQRGKK